MKFCTIASGSSGNSSYVGIGGQNFLVDAGVSGKRIENALFQMDVRNIDGIFITHEHRDHIVGAGVMARRFKLNLYATPLTWRYFVANRTIGEVDASQVKFIEPEKPINMNGVKVTAFDISHDAAQPVGYTFETEDGNKIAFATDLGHETDTVCNHLKDAQIIVLESNHDLEMLKNGPYHYKLKERVASRFGHLSNIDAGQLLSKIAHDKLKHVILAHLSEENNMPMLAYSTVNRILEGNNISIKNLFVAERHHSGQVLSCD